MKPQTDDTLKTRSAVVAASCAAINLRRASRALSQMYSTVLAPCGLQVSQFALLVACAVSGDTPVTALAETLAMDRTTLARNLKPLEREGLVRVVVGDDRGDRRVRVVQLTERGREALSRAIPLWEEAQAQVVESFGLEQLSRVLQDVARLETLAR